MTEGSICLDSSISIHALLTESDLTPARMSSRLPEISIHALLTESDVYTSARRGGDLPYFYPRSPYGERPDEPSEEEPEKDFYPRSPYGERPLFLFMYPK